VDRPAATNDQEVAKGKVRPPRAPERSIFKNARSTVPRKNSAVWEGTWQSRCWNRSEAV